jgi:hypothetical protein
MRRMNEQHIARLEAHLERLVEGTFARLFGKAVRPHEIAVQLARAMEDGIETARDTDPRPLAPDQYIIHMNPQVVEQLAQRQPSLTQILSEHMVELATSAGYRLDQPPVVRLIPDRNMSAGRIAVNARHTRSAKESTAIFKRTLLPQQQDSPQSPQLLINGQQGVPLNLPLINVGRSRENHIVLDDPSVSRHHLQLRLRFGRYTLFDAQSQSGTYVNDVLIKEHRLQSGDVIRIGDTRLIYMEDDAPGETGSITAVELEPPE